MADKLREDQARLLAAVGGGAAATGATLAAGKLASNERQKRKKRSAARRSAIKKETPAQRSRALKNIASRDRAFADAQKSNANKMKQMRAASAAANKAVVEAAEKAEKRIAELRKIRDADINTRQKLTKNAHIKNQRNIIKGKAPKTLLQIAKSVGLRSIPAVGAFISAFSSTSAGKGSDRGLPSRNYKFTPKD